MPHSLYTSPPYPFCWIVISFLLHSICRLPLTGSVAMRFLLIAQLYSIPKTAWGHQSGHHHLICPTGMCLLPIYDCSLFGAMGGSQVLYLHFSSLLHAYRISEGGQAHSNTCKPRVRLTDSSACSCYSSNKTTFINFALNVSHYVIMAVTLHLQVQVCFLHRFSHHFALPLIG